MLHRIHIANRTSRDHVHLSGRTEAYQLASHCLLVASRLPPSPRSERKTEQTLQTTLSLSNTSSVNKTYHAACSAKLRNVLLQTYGYTSNTSTPQILHCSFLTRCGISSCPHMLFPFVLRICRSLYSAFF